MIKLLSRVGSEAKMPYRVCKGSVNFRNKMADRLYKKFCIELDKNAIESVCATEDFTTALKKYSPSLQNSIQRQCRNRLKE